MNCETNVGLPWLRNGDREQITVVVLQLDWDAYSYIVHVEFYF